MTLKEAKGYTSPTAADGYPAISIHTHKPDLVLEPSIRLDLERLVHRIDPLIRQLLSDYEQSLGSVSADWFSFARLSATWSSGPTAVVLKPQLKPQHAEDYTFYMDLVYHIERPGIEQLAQYICIQTGIPVASICDECPTQNDYFLANLD